MASTLTRADIIQQARDLLATADTTILDATKMNRAFQRAQRQWAEDTESLSTEVQTDMVASKQLYDLDYLVPRCHKVRRVRILYATGSTVTGQPIPANPKHELRYIAFEDLPENYEIYRAFPSRWSARGTSDLYLWPKPSTTVSGGLFIDTFNYPADLPLDATGDGISLEFPNSHERGLIWAMCAKTCELDPADPLLGGRLEYFETRLIAEVGRVKGREAEPDDEAVVWASGRNRLRGASGLLRNPAPNDPDGSQGVWW